jgi:hypothetical protein
MIKTGLEARPLPSGLSNMKAARDCMVQQEVLLDHISASDFAAMLGVGHEYARRLIVASERGTKNKSGYWLIGRTWAERFALLRRLLSPAARIDGESDGNG